MPAVENYNIHGTDWQYMMLPVWFMTYKYKGDMYEFAINGQTGKIAGTPPLARRKLRLFCAGIGALLSGAMILCTGLIGGIIK